MRRPDVEIRSVRTADDLDQAIRLRTRAFTGAGDLPPGDLARLCRRLRRLPWYDPCLHRVLTVDGQFVSQVLIADRRLRIGSAWVRCGAVADVCTDPAYRGRGYCQALMRDAVALMARGGQASPARRHRQASPARRHRQASPAPRHRFVVSFLFGLPGFYERFGYATALPEYSIEIPTRPALEAEAGWSARPLRRGDVEAALRVYRRDVRDRSGALSRSAAGWLYQDRAPWPGPFRSWAVADARGRMAGYLRLKVRPGQPPRLVEVGGLDSPGAVRTALAFALARARRAGLETLHADLPPDERLMRWLRRPGRFPRPKCRNAHPGAKGHWLRPGRMCERVLPAGAAARVWRPRTGGGMLSILRPGTLFRQLRGDLERHLRASGLAGSRFVADLRIEADAVRLDWNGDRLAIAHPEDLPTRGAQAGRADLRLDLPQTVLAPLVMGYCEATAAAASVAPVACQPAHDPDTGCKQPVPLSARARRLLDALFPVGQPHLALPDHF